MVDVDLLTDWVERPDEQQQESAIVEYEHSTEEKTTFIVSLLLQKPDAARYKLRLSVINSISTQIRLDYPITEYETQVKAIKGTEAFLDHLSVRLQEEWISRDNPDIENIRETIQDFTGERLFPSLRRFGRQVRRKSIDS